MPSIANFDSAQYWASQAVSRLGATLNSTPKVGDIAWWDATGVPGVGHVAVVDAITYTASGSIFSVKVSDDNAGRLVTTNKVFYPGVNSGTMIYPQKFIRFPAYGPGGAGSRPPVATSEALTSSLETPPTMDGGTQ